MRFTDAAALLFQSAEQAPIDVKSIHVATNEMEEILQLLTERDIEHTNKLPLRSNAYPYSPFPRRTLCLNAANICLSLHLAQSISSSVQNDKPSYIRKILAYILKP